MSIRKTSRNMRPRVIIFAAVAVLAVAVCVGYYASKRYFVSPVLETKDSKSVMLYIPTGSGFEDVVSLLKFDGWLKDESAFRTLAGLMNYGDAAVKAGRYELASGLTARQLLNKLRSGDQKPVRVTFNNIRTLDRLAGVVAGYLERDSVDMYRAMMDADVVSGLGFTEATLPAMFLPDTYEIWWNISPEAFLERMHREYVGFWNESRMAKADSIGLSAVEVSILASIIEEESNKADELPRIAGLYLNRLRKGMRLEACPTVKFAKGDFTIRRVLKADTQIDSPYNTYMYAGLPPGPIRIPSKLGIEAVLNAENNDFLFLCARPDGSGRHAFAKTSAQHARNAQAYHAKLDKSRIFN